MAHHASAKKRIRTNARRRKINRSRVSRIRTLVRRAEEALAGGSHPDASSALRVAEGELRRGVNKGVLRLRTVSRKISRMNARVRALA